MLELDTPCLRACSLRLLHSATTLQPESQHLSKCCFGRTAFTTKKSANLSPSVRLRAAAQQSVSFAGLEEACKQYKRAPPSEKQEYSIDILRALEGLKEAQTIKKWGCISPPDRVNVFQGELKKVGVINAGAIATPTVRNERAFLVTVVGVTSVLALAAGQLPGDWGFFVPYLTGGISIVVLALGSTAPGLLGFFIGKFSAIFPDYRERVLAHEAAHFLTGYLLGVPVVAYSLDIGKAHTDFAEAKLQRRLVEQQLEDSEINQLAIISMAGVASEAIKYEEIQGQTADLTDLQRILYRSKTKLTDQQQQNITRWAVYNACEILKKYKAEFEALQNAMRFGKDVPACIRSIEQA